VKFTAFCERLLGVVFTAAQWVAFAVLFDAIEPGRLETDARALANKLFGEDVETVPPMARRVVVMVKGARVGGTRFSATRLLHLALTVPIPLLAPGEQPFGIIVGPDTRLARQALAFALGAAQSNPDIAERVQNPIADSFEIVRDDGIVVVVSCMPATAGGSAIRGRTLVGALMTEAAFFRDENSVINDGNIFRGLMARIVKDGQCIIESTTWTEAGLLWQLWEKNFGKPETALVAHCPTLLMRPSEEMTAFIEGERQRDPESAAREFDAIFTAIGGSLFFDPQTIDDAVDPNMPHPFKWNRQCNRAAGGDLGLKKDSSALVVALDEKEWARLAYIDELRPEKGFPLAPSIVYQRWSLILKPYEICWLALDQHYIESAREVLAGYGIQVWLAPSGQQGKLETYLATKELLNEGKLRIPNHPRLISQLKAVISKPQPGGGLRIEVPRRLGQGHGDIVSAATLSLYQIWKFNVNATARDRHEKRAREVMEQLPAWGSAPTGPTDEYVIKRATRLYEQTRYAAGEHADPAMLSRLTDMNNLPAV
jgi:hypothetical protein